MPPRKHNKDCEHKKIRYWESIAWDINRDERTAKIGHRSWPTIDRTVWCFDCERELTSFYDVKELQEIVEQDLDNI